MIRHKVLYSTKAFTPMPAWGAPVVSAWVQAAILDTRQDVADLARLLLKDPDNIAVLIVEIQDPPAGGPQ